MNQLFEIWYLGLVPALIVFILLAGYAESNNQTASFAKVIFATIVWPYNAVWFVYLIITTLVSECLKYRRNSK